MYEDQYGEFVCRYWGKRVGLTRYHIRESVLGSIHRLATDIIFLLNNVICSDEV